MRRERRWRHWGAGRAVAPRPPAPPPRGAAALAAARRVLDADPTVSGLGLALYSLRAARGGAKRVAVRLDARASPTGSPSLADVSAFSRAFNSALVDALGEEEAGGVEVEASSPGADRALRLPADLARFAGLPLAVTPEPGSAAATTLGSSPAIVTYEGEGQGGPESATFAVADTRATRGPSGKLSAKQRAARFDCAVGELARVALYVDI